MAQVFRFLIPAGLILFSLFLMPGIPTTFHSVSRADMPETDLSLCMLPLLIPAAIFTMLIPRLGCPSLAVIGALGAVGKLLSPSTFHSPFYIGLGPFMFLLAFATGIIVAWECRSSNRSRT